MSIALETTQNSEAKDFRSSMQNSQKYKLLQLIMQGKIEERRSQ